MLVSSGIEFDRLENARDEILAQLEAVARGEISEEELTAAKVGIASELRAMTDSQGELEGFYLSQTLDGLDYGPLELAELVMDVTKEEVAAVAKSVVCDQIYFLSGSGESEEEEDAEIAE